MSKLKQVEISNTVDIRKIINDEINQLRTGSSNPARGNAMANLVGKMLQSVKLDIEVHRYVSSGKREVKGLNTPLLEADTEA